MNDLNFRKPYDAPKVVAREDLKEITLYTGFNSDDRTRGGRPDGRRLLWDMP